MELYSVYLSASRFVSLFHIGEKEADFYFYKWILATNRDIKIIQDIWRESRIYKQTYVKEGQENQI